MPRMEGQTINAPLMVLESWLPQILSMSLAMHTTVEVFTESLCIYRAIISPLRVLSIEFLVDNETHKICIHTTRKYNSITTYYL